MNLLRRLCAVMAVLCLALGTMRAAQADASVPIDVHLTLLNADGSPAARLPARLVWANAPDAQAAHAGLALVADDAGRITWSTHGTPERRKRKLPTNFWSQLGASARTTVHFPLAVQLPYLGRDWRFVIAVDYFDTGESVQFDGIGLFGPDTTGAFTIAVRHDDAGWHFPGLPVALATPGVRVVSLRAEPTASGWTVLLTLQRSPEPKVR